MFHLLRVTENARLQNVDAEQIMSMFSAAEERTPNSTICYICCVIQGNKNYVLDFFDSLDEEKKELENRTIK